MIWIFLAVVLVLLVYSPGFRRVVFWLTFLSVAALIVCGSVSIWQASHPAPNVFDQFDTPR